MNEDVEIEQQPFHEERDEEFTGATVSVYAMGSGVQLFVGPGRSAYSCQSAILTKRQSRALARAILENIDAEGDAL